MLPTHILIFFFLNQGSEQMEPLLSGSKKHENQPQLKESTSHNNSKDNTVETKLELNELNPNLGDTNIDTTDMTDSNSCSSSSVIPQTSGQNISNSTTLNSNSAGGLPMGNGPGSCNVQLVTSSLLPNPVVEGSHRGRANSSCSHPRNGENQLLSLSSTCSPFPETSAQSFSMSSSSSLPPQDVTPSNHLAISSSPHGDQKQHSSIRTLYLNSTNQYPASTTTSTTTTSGPHINGDSIITSSTATVPPLSATLTPSSTSMTTNKSSSNVISTNCPLGSSDIDSDPKNTSPKPGPIEFHQSYGLTSDNHGNNIASDIVQTKENRTATNGMDGAPWPTTPAEDNDLSSSGNSESLIPDVTCLPQKNQDSAVSVDQGVV